MQSLFSFFLGPRQSSWNATLLSSTNLVEISLYSFKKSLISSFLRFQRLILGQGFNELLVVGKKMLLLLI